MLLLLPQLIMADELTAEQIALQKKRAFKKFSYRGVDLDALLDLNHQVSTAAVVDWP